MKYKVMVGLLTVIVAVLVVGIVTAKPAPENPASTVTAQSSWQTITDDLLHGSTLLDVRTGEEFNQGHISGSTLLPLADIRSGKLPSQEFSKPLYIYCRSGNRSAQAKEILEKAGFTTVIDLGAMSSVIALGAQQI